MINEAFGLINKQVNGCSSLDLYSVVILFRFFVLFCPKVDPNVISLLRPRYSEIHVLEPTNTFGFFTLVKVRRSNCYFKNGPA